MFKLFWREDGTHEWVPEMESSAIRPIIEYISQTPVLTGEYKGVFTPSGYIFFRLNINLKDGRG